MSILLSTALATLKPQAGMAVVVPPVTPVQVRNTINKEFVCLSAVANCVRTRLLTKNVKLSNLKACLAEFVKGSS